MTARTEDNSYAGQPVLKSETTRYPSFTYYIIARMLCFVFGVYELHMTLP